ncbi:MAG: hypothetical protein LBD59_00975 [Prevotellaceae bacterium]|nr:hypothetical protein [Prevotellaceae bacterium]
MINACGGGQWTHNPRCWDKVLPCPPLSTQAVPASTSLLAGTALQNKPDEAQPRPEQRQPVDIVKNFPTTAGNPLTLSKTSQRLLTTR